MELTGKRVLVTGGAVRLGRWICQAFAREGAKLVIHYHRSEEAASEFFESLGGSNAGHALTRGDLTDSIYRDDLFDAVGPIDVLVNNASVFHRGNLADEVLADARRQFEVNFWAPLDLMRRFWAQKRPGAIVNLLDCRIASIVPENGSYALSKKALAEATLAAASSWAPLVRVNAVAPGAVFPPKGMEHSKMEKELAKTPTGKAVAAEDVADACVFLVRVESLTGQILYPDGGRRFRH